MSLILSLGVIEIPYANEPKEQRKVVRTVRGVKARAKAKSAPKPAVDAGKTTGDVATILEAKYHIMENFAHRYNGEIVKAAETALVGQLENLIAGVPTNGVHYGEAESAIEDSFRKFLDNRELDGTPGVPTLAALRGVSHRFKHPYAKRPERPSFIDTGLMQAAFVAQIKE
jgi:hypothetical protein